jgi:hypothetical protein
MLTPASSIAIIGFSDNGRSLGAQLAARGCLLRAYDAMLDAESTRELMQDHIEASGLDAKHTLAAALRGAKLVIATVDAKDSAATARAAATLLVNGQIYLDLSGASAAVHQENALLITGSGAQHIVGQLQTTLSLTGPAASSLAEALQSLGCSARAVGDLPPAVPLVPGHYETIPPAPRRGELP